MKSDAGDWSDYGERPRARRVWVLVLVVGALAFIAGVASGAAGMEFLFFKWKP